MGIAPRCFSRLPACPTPGSHSITRAAVPCSSHAREDAWPPAPALMQTSFVNYSEVLPFLFLAWRWIIQENLIKPIQTQLNYQNPSKSRLIFKKIAQVLLQLTWSKRVCVCFNPNRVALDLELVENSAHKHTRPDCVETEWGQNLGKKMSQKNTTIFWGNDRGKNELQWQHQLKWRVLLPLERNFEDRTSKRTKPITTAHLKCNLILQPQSARCLESTQPVPGGHHGPHGMRRTPTMGTGRQRTLTMHLHLPSPLSGREIGQALLRKYWRWRDTGCWDTDTQPAGVRWTCDGLPGSRLFQPCFHFVNVKYIDRERKIKKKKKRK